MGRIHGRPVFVPGTAPGDLIEAELRDRGRHLEGRLLRVLEPGAARVAAPCVHVAECGGCQWQQVSLDAQREAKRVNLAEALVRIGGAAREPTRTRTRAADSRSRRTGCRKSRKWRATTTWG